MKSTTLMRRWVFVLMCALSLGAAGCLITSGDDGDDGAEQGEDAERAAIADVAREYARAEGIDIEDTVAVIKDETDAWDVAFVPRAVFTSDEVIMGGEVHVVVDKADQSVRRTYRTR